MAVEASVGLGGERTVSSRRLGHAGQGGDRAAAHHIMRALPFDAPPPSMRFVAGCLLCCPTTTAPPLTETIDRSKGSAIDGR